MTANKHIPYHLTFVAAKEGDGPLSRSTDPKRTAGGLVGRFEFEWNGEVVAQPERDGRKGISQG
jgi:hypothetical protein